MFTPRSDTLQYSHSGVRRRRTHGSRNLCRRPAFANDGLLVSIIFVINDCRCRGAARCYVRLCWRHWGRQLSPNAPSEGVAWGHFNLFMPFKSWGWFICAAPRYRITYSDISCILLFPSLAAATLSGVLKYLIFKRSQPYPNWLPTSHCGNNKYPILEIN